jgi:PAS domain S-box-containing protein
MTTGTKIGASFGFALVVIIALGVSSYVSTQRLLEANRWVDHTYQILDQLEHVISVLKDAETGQRGYLLTGQERYLEPYNAATVQIRGDLDSLKTLTADNPAQQEGLKQVQALSSAKLAELQETIELRQTSGLDAALQVVRTDRGKKLMDDLRGLVAEMQSREKILLDTSNESARASAGNTVRSLVIWTPLSLFILAVLATIVLRQVRFGGPVTPPVARAWGSIALRYSFAVAAVVVGALLRWWLIHAFGPLPTYITLYPAVLLVASVAGGGPGILASLLAALVAEYFLLAPYGTFYVESTSDIIGLSIFTGTNLMLCLLAERLRRARWAEAVAEQRELLAVTLASIGDGVIVTDSHGRITFLNSEAENLTGWQLAQARGRPLPTVFIIINEVSRQPVESPVDKVLRLGSVVGLANHTLLLAKDGREIPIDDSGAPIRDAAGTVHGVVLVFRDFTERRQKERELQRLNRTLQALSSSGQARLRATSEAEYLAEVCRIIVEDCGHAMVWIGFAQDDEAKTVRPVASAGFEEGYLQTLNISWADTERGRGPTGTAIRTGQISMCRNMQTAAHFAPWRQEALQRGYASSIVRL